VQLPGGQDLANTLVAANSSINIGLNVSPGYCVGAPSTVSPKISFVQFRRPEDSLPTQYDETIKACPAGTAGCLGTLQTGTVAGVITVGAQFSDSKGQDVGYTGNPTLLVTVPHQNR